MHRCVTRRVYFQSACSLFGLRSPDEKAEGTTRKEIYFLEMLRASTYCGEGSTVSGIEHGWSSVSTGVTPATAKVSPLVA